MKITYDGAQFQLEPGETVLECLERHDQTIASSCRSGICQSCIMKAVSEPPPASAQTGLRPSQKEQGLFLACLYGPTSDFACSNVDDVEVHNGRLVEQTFLNEDVVRLRIAVDDDFSYRAGQFVKIFRPGFVRPYSVASVPELDPTIELHIRLLPGGQMSSYVKDSLEVGDTIEISGATGDCFYTEGAPEKPLVLAGTSTGLAPLLGIVRDALRRGHTGPIRLYHGSTVPKGLYLAKELRSLALEHEQLSVILCALNAKGENDVRQGNLADVILKDTPDFSGIRVFLCGNPDFVTPMRKKVFLAGASMREIHSDPFVSAPPPSLLPSPKAC